MNLSRQFFQSSSRQLLFLLLIILFSSCDKSVFRVSSPSMESTLPANSRLLLHRTDHVSRKDIIAFKYPFDKEITYVFRLIAMPGDTILLSKGRVIINDTIQDCPNTIQFMYHIKASLSIRDRFWEEQEINSYIPVTGGYMIHTTPEKANGLRNIDFIEAVERVVYEPTDTNPLTSADYMGWNKDNFGPLYLPKSGDVITGNALFRYATVISTHEGVDTSKLDSYQFKNNYCFVMGDNRDDAADSRYIGLIPMKDVLGKMTVLF